MVQSPPTSYMTLHVDGEQLFVRAMGTGEPLVVVHGGPGWDHSYLLRPLDRLATRYTVVWFDLRGCGRSSRPPHDACDRSTLVCDLAAVVDAFGGRAHVLGFSFGGRIAASFATERPWSIHSLIMASTSAWSTPSPPRFDESLRRHLIVDPVVKKAFEDAALDGSVTARLANVSAPLDIWNLEQLSQWQTVLDEMVTDDHWLEVFRTGVLQPDPADYPVALAAAQFPVLALHGEFDMRFDVRLAERLAKSVPNCTAGIVRQAGHMAHFEKPDEWLDHISRFLDTRVARVPPSTSHER